MNWSESSVLKRAERVSRWMPLALAVVIAMGSVGCARFRSNRDEVPLRLSRSDSQEAVVPSSSPMIDLDLGRTEPLQPSSGGDIDSGVYRLQIGDTVTVTIRAATVEQFEFIIDENGEVRLPLINPIQAVGLTSTELEKTIQKAYVDQQIYRYVTAHVVVPIRSYFIRGEVRSPGRYPLTGGRVTLLQFIATAGGYTDFAKASRITIIRGAGKITVDARDFERNPEKDITVESGDQIIVDRTWF
jgi:polysaccharide export outer membrane protein